MAINVAIALEQLLLFGPRVLVAVTHVCVFQSSNGIPATQCMHVAGL